MECNSNIFKDSSKMLSSICKKNKQIHYFLPRFLNDNYNIISRSRCFYLLSTLEVFLPRIGDNLYHERAMDGLYVNQVEFRHALFNLSMFLFVTTRVSLNEEC